MTDTNSPPRLASYDKKVGLVLQGGGALGSYQAGVYEALATSEYLPDWVAGISIGAINAAIIAGNAPEKRVEHLRKFWEEITESTAWWPTGLSGTFATWQRAAGGMAAMMFGQPGFFAPRALQEWFSQNAPTSYYNTAALKETLERLVDVDMGSRDRLGRWQWARLSGDGLADASSGTVISSNIALIIVECTHAGLIATYLRLRTGYSIHTTLPVRQRGPVEF